MVRGGKLGKKSGEGFYRWSLIDDGMTTGTTSEARSSEAYGAFAYAYDRALGQRFSRVPYSRMERHPTPAHASRRRLRHGMTVRWFRERGSRRSRRVAAMLQIARGGVVGDMRSCRSAAIRARDVPLRQPNHLLEPDDLQAAFQSIRGVMDADSLFLFDVNHPEIYPEVWGMSEPYIAKGKDYHLEIATTYRKREKIGRAAVTGWAKINGERVEIREQHRQRAYSQRDITRMLANAGSRPSKSSTSTPTTKPQPSPPRP
jgi:hypothetical protein